MKKLLSALLILAPLFVQPAHAADATGVWKATFDTQVGQQNYTYTLMVDGNTVTGTIASANGEGPVIDGTTDGKTISFTENLNFQDMPLVVKYTGTFVSDNEISFTRDVAGFANESLTALRSTE